MNAERLVYPRKSTFDIAWLCRGRMSRNDSLERQQKPFWDRNQILAQQVKSMNLKFVNPANLPILLQAAIERLTANGADFYGWKNAPVCDENGNFSHTSGWGESVKTEVIDGKQALAIYESKLNGAYGERFLNTLGMVATLVAKGKRVAILQKSEVGLPFDASGWVIICIEGYPLFHVNPWDLPMEKITELVNLVLPGTPEWDWTEWKGTDKVSEYTMLLNWLTE